MTTKLRHWLRPESFQFARIECVIIRCGLAWFLLDLIPMKAQTFPGTPYPHGLARWLDLGFLRDASTVQWMSLTAIGGLLLGTLGIAEPLMLGWALFYICAAQSYLASQGFTGHADQLLTLCLLAQWLASLWALRPTANGLCGIAFAGMRSWPTQVWWTMSTIAAGYTVSAITKLINSSGLWPFKGGMFILQMLKAQQERLASYDEAPSALGSWMAGVLQEHPWLGNGLLMPALLLEFFAFLALLNRRASLVIGIGLLFFHQMTGLLMGITFGTHRQLLWLLLVNPVYWIFAAWKRRCASGQDVLSEPSHGCP